VCVRERETKREGDRERGRQRETEREKEREREKKEREKQTEDEIYRLPLRAVPFAVIEDIKTFLSTVISLSVKDLISNEISF